MLLTFIFMYVALTFFFPFRYSSTESRSGLFKPVKRHHTPDGPQFTHKTPLWTPAWNCQQHNFHSLRVCTISSAQSSIRHTHTHTLSSSDKQTLHMGGKKTSHRILSAPLWWDVDSYLDLTMVNKKNTHLHAAAKLEKRLRFYFTDTNLVISGN